MRIISNWPWTGRLMRPREDFRPVKWGFGFEAPGRRISGLAFALSPDAIGQVARLKLWHLARESVSSAFDLEIFSGAPLHDETRLIGSDDLAARIPQFCWFALPELDRGRGLYVCELTLPAADSLRSFGVGVADFTAPWDWQAGWFMVEGGSPRPAKLPAAVAWLLGEACTSGADSIQSDTPVAQEAGAGISIHLPAVEIQRAGWVMNLPESRMTIPAPRSHMLVAEMGEGVAELRLPFRDVELLDPLTDVTLRTHPTRLVRTGKDQRAIRVGYRGWESRYDAISVGDRSGRLHFHEGRGRALDPEEYPAAIPKGHAPVFALYTTFDSAEAIRVDDWHDLVRRGCEAQHVSWLEYCRKRLPRTLKKLHSGGVLRLSGYGDSVTSLGPLHPDLLTAPNGPYRDTFGYFERYGDDWKREQKSQAPPSEDGVRHHRLGWNWQLKRSIEQRWPVTVEYLNWGLPGTTTGSDGIVVDAAFRIPNGSNDERLDLLVRDNPDLVVVAFGTNDVGLGIQTRLNLIRIVEVLQAGGAEVIIVGPCPPNPGWGSRDAMLWMQTYDATLSAAREADVAYVPTMEIFGSGHEGAIGLSQRSYSAASMGNHPGARELKAVGRLLSSIIP